MDGLIDWSLLATIGVIFGVTLFGAYLRSSRRDACLKAFNGYHVTLERTSGKIIWGEMDLETTGFELLYRDTVQDANHVESSYVMYGSEYEEIQAIYRYVDDLDAKDRARRQRELQRYFNPGPILKLLRNTQHFFSLANESMTEVLGMIMGRLRRPAGKFITDASDQHLQRFSSDVVGSVGGQFDPVLERLIGKKVVVDLIENEERHEHVAIFKNYSADFIELLDVQVPQNRALELEIHQQIEQSGMTLVCDEGVLRVSNHTRLPILLQSLRLNGEEEMLNVVVDGGETVELHPDEIVDHAELTFRVVREVDMIVPRRRCMVRHRAERFEPSILPEIIFDLGMMLRGDSRVDARESRLRGKLKEYPNSALLAANLGTVLMQKKEYAEAQIWLERAYSSRHVLPDNGKRTLMLLNELRRRREKSPGQVAKPRTDKPESHTIQLDKRLPVDERVTIHGTPPPTLQ